MAGASQVQQTFTRRRKEKLWEPRQHVENNLWGCLKYTDSLPVPVKSAVILLTVKKLKQIFMA